MKRKALVIARQPLPFEGPWVDISERELWRVVPDGDYGGNVEVEVRASRQDGTQQILRMAVDGGKVQISGEQARVAVGAEFPHAGPISVILEEVV